MILYSSYDLKVEQCAHFGTSLTWYKNSKFAHFELSVVEFEMNMETKATVLSVGKDMLIQQSAETSGIGAWFNSKLF